MIFECLDCQAIGDGYCSDCATPNEDLRELVEEWEGLGHELRKHANTMEDSARGSTWEQAARELEQVLEE